MVTVFIQMSVSRSCGEAGRSSFSDSMHDLAMAVKVELRNRGRGVCRGKCYKWKRILDALG